MNTNMLRKRRGGSLPIEPSIRFRLALNIEMGFWVNIICPHTDDDHVTREQCRALLTPVRMKRCMANTNIKNREVTVRENSLTVRYPVEKLLIKKVVGEFY